MNFKKIFFIIFIYILSLTNINALEPDFFVQSTVDRASKILSENISKDDKINQLKKNCEGKCRHKRCWILFSWPN